MSALIPTFALLFAMLIWGSSFVAMKIAIQVYDPLLMVALRMFIATLCFLLFFKKLRQVRYVPGDWKYLFALALCEPCFYFIFESYALVYTTASQAGMITAILPVLVAISAQFFLKEFTHWSTYFGFLIALGGVCCLTFYSPSTETAPNPLLGNSLEFVAMCFAAAYTLLARHLGGRYPAFFLTAIQVFLGSIFFAPVLVFVPFPVQWDWEASMAILYLGVIVSLFAYGLYNFSLRHMPASQVAGFTNLLPVITLILSWSILGETLNFLQGLGAAFVLLGVWLANWSARLKRNAIAQETKTA